MLAPSPPCSWARDNRALGTLLNGPRQRPVKWGVDLAALLRDLAEPYASRSEQAELNFTLEIESAPVDIKGDAAQLGTLI